jgi:hypothetical protein
MDKSIPAEPASHTRRPRIVAIVTNGRGQLSTEVWYENETGQGTLIANELVENLTAPTPP